MDTKPNLETWNKLEKTDPEYTKKFDKGTFKGTAINPTYQIKKMTEMYGACGTGWSYSVQDVKTVELASQEVMVYVTIALFVGGNRDGIVGVGGDYIYRKTQNGFRADDDAMKKATTDALVNAFKFLGMCADVYLGRYDDNKYVQELKDEKEKPIEDKETRLTQEQKSQRNVLFTRLGQCTDKQEIESFLDEHKTAIDAMPDTDLLFQEIENKLEQLKKGIPLTIATSHTFAGVDDAIEWLNKIQPVIAGFKTPEQLINWQTYNQPFINGTDCLSAKKYIKDGKLPKERLTDALAAKLATLTQAPIG